MVIDGAVFIVTDTVLAAVAEPHALLAVKEYTPAPAVVMFTMVGLWDVDE